MDPPDNDPPLPGDGPRVTETVVLARDNTPARLLLEEDEGGDAGRLEATGTGQPDDAETAGPEQREQTPSPEKPRRSLNPIPAVLALLRLPEELLKRRYYRSRLHHWLRENSEWYQKHQGERQLASHLEDVYGGSDNAFHHLIRFARSNVLATLIIISVAAILFNDYLSQPATSRSSQRTAASTTGDGPRVDASSIATDANDAAPGRRMLDHCAVTDTLRASYAEADDPLKSRLLAEVGGFVRVYDSSDIGQWYTRQQNKRDIVVSRVEAALPKVRAYRQRLAAEIKALMAHRTALSDRLKRITADPSLGVEQINQSIKLRAELANIEARITYGPSMDALTKLDHQLQRLDGIIAGDLEVHTPVVSYWAIQTSEQSEASVEESVTNIIDKDIHGSIQQGSHSAPEAVLLRLEILVATIRHFGDLIGQLKNSSNFFEAQVDQEQAQSNERLRQLLSSGAAPEAQFLDYANCLTRSVANNGL